MDSKEALRALLARSDKPKTAISLELGKSSGYVNSYLTMGRAPGADVLADIAGACGYRLALVPAGDQLPAGSIVIDPAAADRAN